MHIGQYILLKLLCFLPQRQFRRIVEKIRWLNKIGNRIFESKRVLRSHITKGVWLCQTTRQLVLRQPVVASRCYAETTRPWLRQTTRQLVNETTSTAAATCCLVVLQSAKRQRSTKNITTLLHYKRSDTIFFWKMKKNVYLCSLKILAKYFFQNLPIIIITL